MKFLFVDFCYYFIYFWSQILITGIRYCPMSFLKTEKGKHTEISKIVINIFGCEDSLFSDICVSDINLRKIQSNIT